MTKPHLLVVDDDRHVLESMAEWLRGQGYELDASPGYADALERLRGRNYELVLADVRLRDGDGFDLLEQCRRNWASTQVILMTGYGTPDGAIEAIHAGAFDYVTKPLIGDELRMAIERALSQRSVQRENDNLRAQLDRRYGMDNIIGRDPRMLKVFEMIASVADTRATVLVTGESGTGKSMIARAIHRRSGRAKGPFVEVACGALPETLLESELFGHVAGAFTGAAGEKMGKFLQAHGGTIFLDEIGTASPAMQVKLLRVLQELKFEQVGGTKTFEVDVRVVLATNDDLSRAVAEGRFRQDLYYRINVINVELPPLRARPSDVLLLAHSFLEQVREDSRRPVTAFADDAQAAMERYHWPGNVRELQNVVERAVLLGKGPVITLGDLPSELRGTGSFITTTPVGQKTLKEALEGPERQIIRDVLESNNWNRNATADQLGINRTTLYKKMKRLGLEDGRVGVPS
jgi:DNA-binding NtrC family response regulator